MERVPVAIRLAQRYAATFRLRQFALPFAGLPGPEVAAAQIDIALAGDRGEDARALARGLVAAQGGASARIRLGLAQLACADLDAARASLLVALDARDVTPRLRAKAHLGLAQVALRRGGRGVREESARSSMSRPPIRRKPLRRR